MTLPTKNCLLRLCCKQSRTPWFAGFYVTLPSLLGSNGRPSPDLSKLYCTSKVEDCLCACMINWSEVQRSFRPFARVTALLKPKITQPGLCCLSKVRLAACPLLPCEQLQYFAAAARSRKKDRLPPAIHLIHQPVRPPLDCEPRAFLGRRSGSDGPVIMSAAALKRGRIALAF